MQWCGNTRAVKPHTRSHGSESQGSEQEEHGAELRAAKVAPFPHRALLQAGWAPRLVAGAAGGSGTGGGWPQPPTDRGCSVAGESPSKFGQICVTSKKAAASSSNWCFIKYVHGL